MNLLSINTKEGGTQNKTHPVPCSLVVDILRQQYLSQLYEGRVVRKARVIVDDNSHVLAKCYEILPSGRRFRVQKSNMNQYHF